MKVRIENVRVSFANGLWEARAQETNQTPKYGADFIIMPDTKVFKEDENRNRIPTTMEKVLLEVANDTWKGKGQEMLADLEWTKKCLRDGNKRKNKAGEIYEEYADRKYVTAKNKARPGVFHRVADPETGKPKVLEERDGVVYSGCYVNATIEVFGVADPKRKGVHAELRGVQFYKDGDSFGGGSVSRADDFDDLGEGAQSEDEDALA